MKPLAILATLAALVGCSTSTTERLRLPPLELPGRDCLWVLSRVSTMPEATYEGVLARLRAQGYDPSQLKRTRHRAEARG
ncbi:MAG: lipocalin family protein [Deltaproteobacteria bacterium]|nr:lipocalin family protein [Deltaproteobacteria bacterium]